MSLTQLNEELYTYFGKQSFLKGQQEIIEDVLQGKDVLGILPTGSGKSLCYQLPAKKLPGSVIVVSPLISLMNDQVKQLKAENFKEVIALNSFMDTSARKKEYPKLSTYKLIYISPELLQQKEVMYWLKKCTINLFVVDEAHCISQWGHEFRPDYMRLHKVINDLQDPAVLALSATATEEVRRDIMYHLNKPEMKAHIYPIDRENIIYDVKKTRGDKEKIRYIADILRTHHIPVIIYFSSRYLCEHMAETLSQKVPGRQIAYYHGGMEQMDRTLIQQQFMNDQIDVICATSAFGMGINKQNIRMVIHYHLPAQLESYIQETGRAGRDGKSSVSLLLYNERDKHIPKGFIKRELPTMDEVSSVWNRLAVLYKKSLPIPTGDTEIYNYFRLSEIQWRFLFYQMTKHGMIREGNIIYDKNHWQEVLNKINPRINARIKQKEAKLDEMLEWVSADGCLRKKLFKGFQNAYSIPEGDCCSNCGFEYTEWKPRVVRTEHAAKHWSIVLRKKLIGNDQL